MLVWVLGIVLACAVGVQGTRPQVVATDVFDAENVAVVNGRIFVTGGANVYEINVDRRTRSEGLYDGECNFTGITVVGGALFAACTEGTVLAAKHFLLRAHLSGTPSFEKVLQLKGMALPNGMTSDGGNHIFLADTNLLHGGGIVRITVNANLTAVQDDRPWAHEGLQGVNGIKMWNGTIFVTEILGKVKKVQVNNDGTAGVVSTIFTRLTAFDDLLVTSSGILVCDYTHGTILALSDGEEEAETARIFSFPSSVTELAPNTYLVTEKGLIGDKSPLRGNRVSLYRPAL